MASRLKQRLSESIREVVFGLEDSFVSTMGTVSGVAIGSGSAYVVLLTGVVLVVVEAISMAAGSYLSSKAAQELYDERVRQDKSRVLHERVTDDESLAKLFARKGFSTEETRVALNAIARERKLWLKEVSRGEYRFTAGSGPAPLVAAIVMGICYTLGGLVTLIPYLVLPVMLALPVTIAMTSVLLFGVGILKARLADTSAFKSGTEMVVISLGAAVAGLVIGRIVSMLSGVALPA